MKIYAIPQKYIDIFQELYTNSRCCVKTGSGTTDYFKVETGFQQGDIPSSFFFHVVMNYIMTKAMSPSHFGIICQETKLTDLDDLALLTNEWEQMQLMADSLKNLSKKVGFRISLDEMKVQKIGKIENDIPLEAAKNVTYLGSIQSNIGDIEKYVKSRIGKTCSIFRRLQTVWGSRVISLTVKL